MDPFLCRLISFVVADLIGEGHCAIVDHCLCGMAFDLGDGYGGGAFGLYVLVVQLPKVSILLDSPGPPWCGVVVDVCVDRESFGEEALAVSSEVYGAVCSKGHNGTGNLQSGGGSPIP